MEDLVSMCERHCRKECNLCSAAEDSEETCHSGSTCYDPSPCQISLHPSIR